MSYQPLPENLRLGVSDIHELGVFATENIKRDSNLGMSHLELGQLLLRTPMGGFLNHSENPNCIKLKSLLTRQQWNENRHLSDESYNIDFKKWDLITLEDIKKGEELTVKYTFYKI